GHPQLLVVLVGRGGRQAEPEVVRGRGVVAEAVRDRLDVHADDVVVRVVQPVALTARVRRIGHRAEVAVREVRHVGDRGGAVGQELAYLGDVRRSAVYCGLGVPEQGTGRGRP